ncbi:trypsin-like peptidase domain-containing protein [Gimesia maris]|uniref:trypsin-like peptidase domain-containing protein n=1 Tax=Gimesia maris TaxID=122 RepID=UPI0030DB8731|tara:strand:+ start:130695 stop:131537 length:843 start_codon:yes stop_codon:yes gene_type:complete
MRTLTILFVLLITSVVQAQALAVRVTETECTPNGCRQLIGTGACAYVGDIESRSVFLTAAHNVNKAKTIHVGYNGQWWGARVVHKQHEGNVDFAIIETQSIKATKCFKVAEAYPGHGVDAVAYGYSNGVYNLRSLRAKIRVTRSGRYFSKVVAKGDSGGPILVNGQVVGIISGHDYQQTIYTDGVLIRRQLIQIYGRLPQCGCEPLIVEETPEAPPADNTDLAALQGEVTKLRAEIDKLNKTQIPVWIVGSDGEPVAKQTYPLGDPIKLRFKAVKQSEAE